MRLTISLFLYRPLSLISFPPRSPPFTAIHFDGQQRPFNLIYDLPRFYAATGVPAIPLGFLKSPAKPAELKTDLVTCWSTMEIYTGAVNNHQVESGFTAHGVATNFWALPRFPRSSEGAVIEFRPLLDFLGNRTRQLEWVEETKRDLLPQKPVKEGVELKEGDRAENIKPYFDPVHWRAPTEDEQITCVDATFYVGQCVCLFPSSPSLLAFPSSSSSILTSFPFRSSVPPPPYPQHIPLEPWRGQAWKDVGQHLHFIPEVVEIADAYLQRIFGVSRGRDAPPYISVHMYVNPSAALSEERRLNANLPPGRRRGDFKQFHGNTFTPLANYVTSVSTLRRSLQERLDAPLSTAERGGKPALKRFATPPAEYEVVVTSDEEEDSGLWREVEELGWKRVDHVRTVLPSRRLPAYLLSTLPHPISSIFSRLLLRPTTSLRRFGSADFARNAGDLRRVVPFDARRRDPVTRSGIRWDPVVHA